MKRLSAIRVLIIVLIGLAVTSLLLFSRYEPMKAEAGNVELALKAPPFVQPASTQYDQDYIASVLDNYAGISAYYQAPVPINLDDVEGLFRTTQITTSDYILGTMEVPSNPEEFDVHMYIDTSGWMLVYYFNDQPTVRIFDWPAWSGSMNPTRFQSVLNHVALVLGLPTPEITYYDFRYPNATNLLLAVEEGPENVEHSFDILATDFSYYERSWGVGGSNGLPPAYSPYQYYKLDGVEIHRRTEGRGILGFDIGTLSPAQLPAGSPHTIAIGCNSGWVMGVLAIAYGQ